MRIKRVINFVWGRYEGMLDANFPDVLGLFVTYLFEMPLNQKTSIIGEYSESSHNLFSCK